MVTRVELTRFLSIQTAITDGALEELLTAVATIPGSDAWLLKETLQRVMPSLVHKYGEAMAVASADYFEQLTGVAGRMADLVPDDVVETSARWAVGDSFKSGNQTTSLNRAGEALNRHILQAGRETVQLSAEQTNGAIGFARMLRGTQNCAFCVTMAGRGAVYGEDFSDESAASKKYHDKCKCVVVPIRGPEDWPEDYDFEGIQRMYEEAREQADYLRLKGGAKGSARRPDLDEGGLTILQAMRELHGLK